MSPLPLLFTTITETQPVQKTKRRNKTRTDRKEGRKPFLSTEDIIIHEKI
jgi:hypothetical protein